MVSPSRRYIKAFKIAKKVIYSMAEKNSKYEKNKDLIFELLVTCLLYVNEKGYDLDDVKAVYDIFKDTNLTVLKHKFGSMPKMSEAAESFFGFRSRIPDAELNETIQRLTHLLKEYIEEENL